MRSVLIAAALLLTSAAPVLAQSERAAIGTGVTPSLRANSAERPIAFAASAPSGGVLVLPVRDPADLSSTPAALRPTLERAVAAGRFKAKRDDTLSVLAPVGYDRVLLIGTGTEPLDQSMLNDLGGRAAQATRSDAAPVTLDLSGLRSDVLDAAAHVALGAALGQYRYDRLKTVDRTEPPTGPFTIVTADPRAAETAYVRDQAGTASAVRLARDLITEPSNTKHSERFVEAVREAAAGVPNLRITVLDEAEMRRLGMGSLLSVAQGSRRPARLLIADYRGGGSAAPIAFVGKGITFDSGGISIKPAAGMEDMRSDMAGAAAAVSGAIAAARRGARANVLGVAALAENMPDGNASRPGDVVRTMNGRTIEIINTDAEGRLVLADANQYVIDRYKPAALVNIATLTGAIITALGDDYAGLFARDEALAARVQTASTRSGEAVWRMPIHPSYAKDMASPIADIANSASGGAGSGRAAHFISFLTPEPTPWAHIDIAGVELAKDELPSTPKGARGWGVRLFNELVRAYER